MQIIVHADDYGASLGVTDTILDAFDNGVLSSVSVIPNAASFDYAIAECKKRKGLKLGVHLNLVEGMPLLPAEKVPGLIDGEGKFRHSFLSLSLAYLLSGRRERRILYGQVRDELSAQISKVKSCFGEDFVLRLDSHQHLHMIPFVFDAVLELARDFNVGYIRMPQEIFFWSGKGADFIKGYCSSNIVKHVFLNLLASRGKEALSKRNIASCDYFIGVLFSGCMSEDVVKSALARLPGSSRKDATVEILFHPGSALPEEAAIWEGDKGLIRHYCSLNRRRELQELKRDSFREFLRVHYG